MRHDKGAVGGGFGKSEVEGVRFGCVVGSGGGGGVDVGARGKFEFYASSTFSVDQ